MDLPKLSEVNVQGKKVLARLDLDVSTDTSRIEAAQESMQFLVKNSQFEQRQLILNLSIKLPFPMIT